MLMRLPLRTRISLKSSIVTRPRKNTTRSVVTLSSKARTSGSPSGAKITGPLQIAAAVAACGTTSSRQAPLGRESASETERVPSKTLTARQRCLRQSESDPRHIVVGKKAAVTPDQRDADRLNLHNVPEFTMSLSSESDREVRGRRHRDRCW